MRLPMLGAIAGIVAMLAAGSTMAADRNLEVVAKLDRAPGNIGVAPDGTVIVSVHPALQPKTVALAIRDGAVRPFPPAGWSRVLAAEPADKETGLRPVLGVRVARDGRAWLLSGGRGQLPKHIYVWDRAKNRLAQDFQFRQPEAQLSSFYNDLALAPDHNAVFISEPGGPALVVVDTETGAARRVLEGHESVRPEGVTAEIDGRVLGAPGPDGEVEPLMGAVNPITIDPQEEWVYYGAMTGESIWRVKVEDLLNADLSAKALGRRVERYGPKPPSAGITIDDAGHVYITDIQAKGVGVTTPEGYRLVVQDEKRISWPDGLSTGPDGYIYIAANSLHRIFPSHRDMGPPEPPFYITRFKALGPTTVGR